MSLIKKIKYILLILLLAGVVQGYFLINYFLIQNVDHTINESVGFYEIVSARDPLFSELIAYYREGQARNASMFMRPGDLEQNNNMTSVNFIDYF